MTIFSRYVFRQATGALLLVLLSLTGIVWISLALRELNVVTGAGQSALVLLKMTTLGLPNFVATIAPFALIIAIIHTLNRLNSDSEIIVFAASGANNWAVARPVLTLALLVAAFVAFVNHAASPWSLRQLREMVVQVRTDLLTQVIQPGRFSSPEAGLTLHIRERAPSGTLLGLIMHDARDDKQVQSYLAEQGVIVKQDDTAYLVMTNGHILRRSGAYQPTQIIAFDKYAVDLDRFEPKTAAAIDLKPRERYLSELLNPDVNSGAYKESPGKFRSELHERFAGPLYPLAFAFIALACVGQAQSTRQSRVQRLAAAFVLAVGLRLGGLAVNNVVTINAAATPILYLLPLVGIVVPAYLISRNAEPARSNALADRIGDAIVTGFGKLRRLLPQRAPATASGI